MAVRKRSRSRVLPTGVAASASLAARSTRSAVRGWSESQLGYAACRLAAGELLLQLVVRLQSAQQRDHGLRIIARASQITHAELVGLELLLPGE